jgi:DNA helicase-2/ATP-dependent DNA helicase PcrA
MTSIRNLALKVQSAMSIDIQLENTSDVLLRDWDIAIASLIKTRSDEADPKRVVQLPESMSATDIQRLMSDESAYIAELIRPMPRASHYGADMGTRFHEWVENYYRQKATHGLLMALPGTEDFNELQSDIIEQSDLRQLIERFRTSPWSEMHAYAVEEPFTVLINDRIVKGRIDAVFQDGERWLLVDWKTHAQLDADPLQLSIYRIAFGKKHNIAVEDIDAVFVYVRRNETFTPSAYVSEVELTF